MSECARCGKRITATQDSYSFAKYHFHAGGACGKAAIAYGESINVTPKIVAGEKRQPRRSGNVKSTDRPPRCFRCGKEPDEEVAGAHWCSRGACQRAKATAIEHDLDLSPGEQLEMTQ